HSWSLVDPSGRAKPAWHAVRRASLPRFLAIEPTGGFEQGTPGALEVVLADDAAFREPERFAALRARAVVERVAFDGEVRARTEVALSPFAECGLPAATLRGRIPEAFLASCRREHELLVARVEGDASVGRAEWFLADDASLALPAPAFDRSGGPTARAACVIREFWIEQSWPAVPVEPARARAECDVESLALEAAALRANWRTLLPGDEVEFPASERIRWWCANSFARLA
ncbi:MAG: hypothetical protein ACKO0W_03935, partial [Planctomycetota bacterium]